MKIFFVISMYFCNNTAQYAFRFKKIKPTFFFISIYSCTSTGQYMYIESSSPREPHDIAALVSPLVVTEAATSCLAFWYHMEGTTLGALTVEVGDAQLHELTTVWTRAGRSLGNQWHWAAVTLDTRSPMRVCLLCSQIVSVVAFSTYARILGEDFDDPFPASAFFCFCFCFCFFLVEVSRGRIYEQRIFPIVTFIFYPPFKLTK